MKRALLFTVLITLAAGVWWFARRADAPARTVAGSPLPGRGRDSAALRTPAGVMRAVDEPWRKVAPTPRREAEPELEGAGAGEPTDPAQRQGVGDEIPGEYVLGFYNWQESEAFVRKAREWGIEILDRIALGNAVRVRTGDEDALRRLLAEGPRPIHFGPNYVVRTPPGPPQGDTRAPESGYRGFGAGLLEWLGVEDNSGWGKGVTVAVLDTAVGSHTALPEGHLRRVQLEADTTVGTAHDSEHGTAVASLIVGRGAGMNGIAPAANILSVPVIAGDGSGDTFSLARGIMEAVALGADVINLSLGTYGDSPIVREAVDYALASGVAIVAATGNDAVSGVTYPARYDGVVAVGAADANNRHLYFSNRGAEVDLVAPGIGLNAAWGEDEVAGFSGTSAATPLVSGAIAALMSENPGMSATEAAALLTRYADDYGAPGADEEYGAGVLNIERAMERDVAGIYDAAVGPVFVDESVGEASQFGVSVYAQNRGTEAAQRVTLQVVIDGREQVFTFNHVGVGETVSHLFVMDRVGLAESGAVSVYAEVLIDGVEDANLRDNTGRTVLHLAPMP